MPRIVAYAPRQMGGIGLQRLHTTRGVRNLTLMLKHLRAKTTLGKLFQIAIDWLQRWSGIGVCVMARPERRIPPTSAKYLVEIREFLVKCGASVRLKRKPQKLREKDSFIMDHLLNLKWSDRKIDTIKKVRMYFQVKTVAKISNPEGTKIEKA